MKLNYLDSPIQVLNQKIVPILNNWNLAIALILFAGFLIQVGPIGDNDFWWHLKTGEWILSHGEIPRTNIFSFSEPNQKWVIFEWFTQVLFQLCWGNFGFAGIFALRAILIFSTIGLWLAIAKKAGANPLQTVTLFLGFFVFWKFRLGARPELFSYFCIAVIQFIFILNWKHQWQKYLLLALTQILWTNTHGYYFCGPLLALLFPLLDFIKTREKNSLLETLTAPVLMGLASLVNPHGLEIWTLLIQHQGTVVLKSVSEFLPYSLNTIGPEHHLGLIWFCVTFFIALKDKHYYFPVVAVWTLFWLYQGLNHERLAWLGFTLLFPLSFFGARHLLGGSFLNLFCCVLFFFQLQMGSVWEAAENKPRPQNAVNYLIEQGFKPNLYHEYDDGGWLLHRYFPKIKVFMDGRFAYSEPFYKKFLYPKPENLNNLLKPYNINSAVLYFDFQNPMVQCLTYRQNNWMVPVYLDKHYAAFSTTPSPEFKVLNLCKPQDNAILAKIAATPHKSTLDYEFQTALKWGNPLVLLAAIKWAFITDSTSLSRELQKRPELSPQIKYWLRLHSEGEIAKTLTNIARKKELSDQLVQNPDILRVLPPVQQISYYQTIRSAVIRNTQNELDLFYYDTSFGNKKQKSYASQKLKEYLSSNIPQLNRKKTYPVDFVHLATLHFLYEKFPNDPALSQQRIYWLKKAGIKLPSPEMDAPVGNY